MTNGTSRVVADDLFKTNSEINQLYVVRGVCVGCGAHPAVRLLVNVGECWRVLVSVGRCWPTRAQLAAAAARASPFLSVFVVWSLIT